MYWSKEVNTRPDIGGLPCSTFNKGKVLVKGSFGLAFLHLHTIHPPPICLTDTLPLITENLSPFDHSSFVHLISMVLLTFLLSKLCFLIKIYVFN